MTIASCASVPPLERQADLYPIYTVIPKPAPLVTARELPTVSARRRAVSRYSPRSWFPKNRQISSRWKTIVLHHSGTDIGGAKRFDKHHRVDNGWDELGYHFVIGNGTDTPDGFVEAGPRWQKQKHGAHCKTSDNYYNEHGIGICLVGDFTQSSPTRKQLVSMRKLVRFLSRSCHIPPNKITTHRAITGKTQCPGRNFPLSALAHAPQHHPTLAYLP